MTFVRNIKDITINISKEGIIYILFIISSILSMKSVIILDTY